MLRLSVVQWRPTNIQRSAGQTKRLKLIRLMSIVVVRFIQSTSLFCSKGSAWKPTSSPSNAMIVLLPIYRFQGVAIITSQLKSPPSLAEIFEMRSLSASTARRISASQANSSGEWLTPFLQRTKSMAVGHRSAMAAASCVAPDGVRRGINVAAGSARWEKIWWPLKPAEAWKQSEALNSNRTEYQTHKRSLK